MILNRHQLASVLGVPPSTVKEWMRPGGILNDRARLRDGNAAVFGPGDVLVGAAYLQLQRVLGEKSPLATELVHALEPRLRAAIAYRPGESRQLALRVVLSEPHVAVSIDLDALDDVLARLAEFA